MSVEHRSAPRPSDARHRIGVVGLGSIGQRMLRHARLHPRVDIAQVWDLDPQMIRSTVAQFPDSHAAGSPLEVIADPSVALLYVASPPSTHAQYVDLALDAGLPILCEKPLGVDVKESERIVERAKALNVANAVNFIFGTSVPACSIKNMLDEDALGGVIGVDIVLHLHAWSTRRYAQAPWLASSAQGGFVREVLTHFVVLAMRLFGELTLESVACEYADGRDRAITALKATATCGAVSVHIRGTTVGVGPDVYDFTIWGERQSVRACNLHELATSDGGPWRVKGAIGVAAQADWYRRQYDAVAAMLEGQANTLADFAEALAVQKVIEDILAGQ